MEKRFQAWKWFATDAYLSKQYILPNLFRVSITNPDLLRILTSSNWINSDCDMSQVRLY